MPELFTNLPKMEKPQRKEKCGQCAHIQKWGCSSKFFFYCGMIKSNRTVNGLMKVWRKDIACDLWISNFKET